MALVYYSCWDSAHGRNCGVTETRVDVPRRFIARAQDANRRLHLRMERDRCHQELREAAPTIRFINHDIANHRVRAAVTDHARESYHLRWHGSMAIIRRDPLIHAERQRIGDRLRHAL